MRKGVKLSWLTIFEGRLTKVKGEALTDSFGFKDESVFRARGITIGGVEIEELVSDRDATIFVPNPSPGTDKCTCSVCLYKGSPRPSCFYVDVP